MTFINANFTKYHEGAVKMLSFVDLCALRG
jgi:hypothetical protein